MRWPALAAIGVAAYAVFLVATLPASVAIAMLHRPEGIRLEQAQGTIWHGSARGVVIAAAAPVALDRLHWRFAPIELLMGRAAFDVDSTDNKLRGHARVARGVDGIRAEMVSVRADAALASALLPIVAPWRPSGALSLQGNLRWDERESLRGDATLEWADASIALPDPRLLGSYRVVLQGDGGPMRATLTTLSGPLALRAEGTVSPTGLAMRGDARAQGPNAETVAPVLDLLGPRRADGSRELALRLP